MSDTSNLLSIDALFASSNQRSNGLSQTSIDIFASSTDMNGVVMEAAIGGPLDELDSTETLNVVMLVDRSWSMNVVRAEVVKAVNFFRRTLAGDNWDDPNDGAAKKESILVTLWFYGNNEITLKFANKPLKSMPTLTNADYEPNGNTPMYMCLLNCLGGIAARNESLIRDGQNVRTIVWVLGDDGDNVKFFGGKQYTASMVKTVVENLKQQETYTFCFALSGSPAKVNALAAEIGFDSVYIMDKITEKELRAAINEASAGVKNFSTSTLGSAGNGFFANSTSQSVTP